MSNICVVSECFVPVAVFGMLHSLNVIFSRIFMVRQVAGLKMYVVAKFEGAKW